MIKKILIIIAFLFLTISNEAIANKALLGVKSNEHTTVFAAAQKVPAPDPNQGELTAEAPAQDGSFQNYIIPGIAGLVIVGGVVSYWLVFRKRLFQ